ncbi:MAG: helicase [Deltaproteobacteria bacterium]|nr:helicase [Deltaproteobacteria bacterium]
MTEPVLAPPSAEGIRDELEKLVVNDLLGPAGGPDEEVDERRVSERYLVGMLAPKNKAFALEEADRLEAERGTSTEDGTPDVTVPSAISMFPSSLGLSFCVPENTPAVKVTARWGWYRKLPTGTTVDDKGEPTLPDEDEGDGKVVWKRTPVEGSKVLALGEGPVEPWVVSAAQPEVVVRGLVRKVEGDLIVSLFLVNGQTEPSRLKDVAWLFQPELVVEGPHGGAVFCRRTRVSERDRRAEPEDARMEMAYRDFVEFAVGHGVGVHWETAPDDPTRATRIETRVVPRHEVKQQESPTEKDVPELEGLELDMKALAEGSRERLVATLKVLPDAYEKWIENQKTRLNAPDLQDFRQEADETVRAWERALGRIREGIALIETNENAAAAFQFANAAMWRQRLRTMIVDRRRRNPQESVTDLETELDLPKNHSWRVFQLGFILQNLAGITGLDHADRSTNAQATADLLWYPTGGGKTEAYLGLTAYTLGLRRLQGVVAGRSGEQGVAVLMRYTLRLLTLQQFQRASALICACEVIRRGDPKKWGKEPFRIGLWVGMKTTPNTSEQSDEWLKQNRNTRAVYYGGVGGSGSPAQLTNCPWCGEPIRPEQNIVVETYERGACRTFTYCGDTLGRCAFTARNSPNEGVPVIVVDEEIYRRLPALVIATVDKFAQLPWNGKTGMLFGQVDGYCPRHGFRSPEIEDDDSHQKKGAFPAVNSEPVGPLRPPDLIIQDELHLISGPLGTLTGLYETVVDRLCSWEVDGRLVRPKVIASTATIRRASDQVAGLFLRKVEVFPPSGLDPKDNFFSVQRDTSVLYGRRYIGICATGRRLKAALIRVYTAFLSAGQALYERNSAEADPWMTAVGYFNSIRELAGMRRLVDDDVRARLRDTDKRGLAKRRAPVLEELTSRKSSTEIPSLLDRMEVSFNADNYPKAKEDGTGKKVVNPLDVLLATNMISVGVDVKRLGLMIVAGQPKTTAEYIQATSRVGRSKAGLVCTVYNWARPRDLSHFESFEHYHATFYRHVEALSVTPFAARALDRGLSALLVALVRQLGQKFNANPRAQDLDRNHPFVREAVESIYRRVEGVVQVKAVADDIRARLENRLDEWLAEAAAVRGSLLGYRMTRDGSTRELLKKAGVGDWELFTCLNSLRDVEPTVNLIVNDTGMRDDPAPTAPRGV